jgi:membrane protein implicated in regulation of membrane protease activity
MIVDSLIKWLKIGGVVLGLLCLGYGVVAFIFPDIREALRDIAIVVLALFQMMAVVLALALLITILYTVKYIHQVTQDTIIPEIKKTNAKLDEVLENTRAIVGNVRDSSDTVTTTTVFTAERVVSPIIRVSGLVAGVRAAAGALARRDVHEDVHVDESVGVEALQE